MRLNDHMYNIFNLSIIFLLTHFAYLANVDEAWGLSPTNLRIASSGAAYFDIAKLTHPRLIINSEDVEKLANAVRTYSAEDFGEVVKYVLWRRAGYTAKDIAIDNCHPNVIMPIALVALLGDDNANLRYGIDCAVELSKVPAQDGDDTAKRERLLCIAILYDWLFDKMNLEERTLIRSGINALIDKTKDFVDDPLFSGGHSRFGNIAVLAGLIAMCDDISSYEYNQLFLQVQQNWRNGYNPFQAYAASGGGYYMGWEYGIAYLSLWPYWIWDKLGYADLHPQWISKMPQWILYGLQGDGTFPMLGDCDENNLTQDYLPILAYVSYKYKDGYAEWLYRKYYSDVWGPYRVWRIIFKDPNVVPIDPTTGSSRVDYAKLFPGSGIVLSRDRWDKNATCLLFKCSPFYTVNHHHKDQNHISLSYKGPLLIDSGCYDAYGSSHWLNYYTRTIAHNSMVVYDPGEIFKDNIVLSNDGGQIFRNPEYLPLGKEAATYNEAVSNKYKIAGVVNFEANDDFCYASGDATRAYNADKVTKYLRYVLMVNSPANRNHPLVFLFDRVKLKKALKPSILFHSGSEPNIESSYFKIVNQNGGIVHGQVLLPFDAQFKKVGGAGSRWWVDGKDYPPSGSCGSAEGTSGAWRVEVTTPTEVESTDFLTILSVDDSTQIQGAPNSKILTKQEYIATVCSGNLFVMCLNDLNVSSFDLRALNSYDIQQAYFVALTPNKYYDVEFMDKTLSMMASSNGLITFKW